MLKNFEEITFELTDQEKELLPKQLKEKTAEIPPNKLPIIKFRG